MYKREAGPEDIDELCERVGTIVTLWAERALSEREKRFRSVLDSMLEGCVILDFEWRYVYFNNAAIRLTSRTREERIGHTLMEVFPGIEKQDVFLHLSRSMKNRTREHYETEFIFPEGRKAWLEVQCEPIPEGIFILYLDITEHKVAEQRLRRQLESLTHVKGIAKTAMMQPIGMLMIEHRLIERVVKLCAKEKARITEANRADNGLGEFVVDFFQTYAFRIHHGKEEEILFKALRDKPLPPDGKRMMDLLIEEHKLEERLVTDLVNTRGSLERGDEGAREQLLNTIDALVQLYPKHIEKDEHFFEPAIQHFSPPELNDMLLQFWEFDRQIIHEKYQASVANAEKSLRG